MVRARFQALEKHPSAIPVSLVFVRWSRPPFPKDRRLRLIDLPVEKIIIARPRVNFDPANLAAEAAGMLGWMLLPRRGVRQTTIGAAKKFGCPYVACHIVIMRRLEDMFQPGSLR
jgi:hypothetical protein